MDEHKNSVKMINQPLLPHKFEIIELKDYKETARAIKEMYVRGAGATGSTGAYGLSQGCVAYEGNEDDFWDYFDNVYDTLEKTRPTAVDLVNGMDYVKDQVENGKNLKEYKEISVDAAVRFADDQVKELEQLGRNGESLIKDGYNVGSHCNAGWLAFVDIGSATAPMYFAKRFGRDFHVFVDETRPRFQGARLTAWELDQAGIKHSIIVDNAMGYYMRKGDIDMMIVGSDRTVGKTGDVANKIGTYEKAVVAKENGIPFYVAIPMSTIDWNLESGDDIPIEERNPREVTHVSGSDSLGSRNTVRVANPGSEARNPSFDVTPAEYITGIITPRGIYKPEELRKLKK